MSKASFVRVIESDLLTVCNKEEDYSRYGTPDSLLLEGMNLAGRKQGLVFQNMAASGNYKVTQLIEAIARQSNVVARKVTLSAHWWKSDCGSLLGFTREGYVRALVFEKEAYFLVDPANGEKLKVNAASARSIHPVAFAFYPLLSVDKVSLSSFVRFGLAGRQKEIVPFLIISVAIGILNIALPLAFSTLIGNVIPSANQSLLLQLSMALIIIGLMIFILTVFRNLVLLRFESKVDLKLQAAVFNKLLMLPAGFFGRHTTGDLVERSMGIHRIRLMVSGPVISAVFNSLFSLSYLALLFFYSSYLAVYAVAALFLYLLILLVLYHYELKIYKGHSKARTDLLGRIYQFVSGISKIKTAGKELLILRQWSNAYAKERKLKQKTLSVNNQIQLLNYVFPGIALLFIYGFASNVLDSIAPANFAGFVTAFGLLVANVMGLGASVSHFLKAVPVYKRLESILKEKGEEEPHLSEQVELKGRIELNQVFYKYEENAPLILEGISLKIEAGQYVAFVGESGSGKSTIFRLLLGFEEPLSGSIYFDDQDLKQLNRKVVRRQMGVVLQNSTLTGGSIFENISGKVNVGYDAVWESLAMVGMDKEIAALPMGLHTVITDSGGGFSGGQKQRLLIARALLNRPKIILFDEATSALDNISQKIIIETLKEIKATKVVIAHRLETIMGADHVYFIGKGNILQSGSPSQLLNSEGPFREFAKKQQK